MPLATIADLDVVTPEEYARYVAYAKSLSSLWMAWKRQHDGNMSVNVEFRGERDRAPGIHASELSGCPRKIVYSLLGTKRIVRAGEKDIGMQRRFDMGTMVHAITQHEMHLMCAWYNSTQNSVFLQFEDEVKISPEVSALATHFKAHSSCDGRFTFWVAGHDAQGQPQWIRYLVVGLEIKTASGDEYQKLKEPKADHKEQTCFYMSMLDIPLMWVLYINKSNQKFTEAEPPFLMKYNKYLWENTLKPRMQEAMDCAAANKLPARSEGMPCGWCPFAHTCQPAYLNYNKGVGPRDL